VKTLLGKFLRWALLTVIVAVLTLLIALYVAVGSEAGTRYILRKAAPHLPVSFDADAVRGTLLSELRVPAVRYSGERVQVTVRDGIVDVDWSRTSTTMLRFDRIRAAAVQIDRQPSETPGDGNIDINMPPLPIALRARAVDVSQLAINDVTINDIMLQRVLARHQTFSASTVSATIRSLFVEAKDASIQLSGPVPVSGRSNWRMSDGSLQGQADIGGTLQRYSADFDATYRQAPDALIRARGSTTGTLQGL
jgi:autotransporter translocation and assembly factor TamB